jgi:ABC-type sugar transport system ATPase subunit
MRSLSVAQEQLVQIAAAVGRGARVLILDEPTSALSEAEARALFALLVELRARGVTLIYVSHRLPEVFELADRISVLRDGHLLDTRPRAAMDADEVVRLMLGRELLADEAGFTAPAPPPGAAERLRVEGLSSPGRFSDVSLRVGAGEIVGLAGLVGAGRSDVARALFGLDPAARGRVLVDGQPLQPGSPRRAMAAGLALMPEDRKRQGLVLAQGARWNWSLPVLARLCRLGLIDRGAERRQAAAALERVDLRAASLEQPVALLSGGNQQKVLLGKWLGTGARVLLVDEPTRGVDVGAKAAIHALLREQAAGGAAILLVSSDLPELLALSTRLVVMRGGRVVGEMARGEATAERLLRAMAGVEVGALP